MNVVVALTIYGVAMIVRTAADAFDSVEPDVRESATALGYSQAGRVLGRRAAARRPGAALRAARRVVSTVSLVTSAR